MNKSLTSDRAYEDHCYPINKINYAMLTVALVAAGYLANRYSVLEPECGSNLRVLEERKAEWVEVYLNALANGIDLTTVPDVNECALTSADDIDTSGSFAALTTALAGANNDLTFTANKKGSIWNVVQVQYVDPAGNNQVLAVTIVGILIRVSLATGGGGAITSTASLILAAVNAHAVASKWVTATLAASNTGAGIVPILAATNLTGGAD